MSVSFQDLSNAIRSLAMDAVEKANSGHPGMPMGMADVATVLYRDFLKFNPTDAQWPDRDRFILSAGHGSMLQYALLYLTGYKGLEIEDIKQFRQLGSKTPGHPEFGHTVGVETTTGPLGQGLANAVGMALAERMMNARFGDDLVSHKTYVIAGDGCLAEGLSQEAIVMGAHWNLKNLVVLFDDNEISIDGNVNLYTSENQVKRFEAAGWYVQAIDGHNEAEIVKALQNVQTADRPSMIACKTIIGYGAPKKSGSADCHGSPLGAAEIEGAKKNLGITYPAFEIPKDILDAWRAMGQRNRNDYLGWNDRYELSEPTLKATFKRQMDEDLPLGWNNAIQAVKQKFCEEGASMATRKASQVVIDYLVPLIPELIGGSADLTGSNLTKAQTATPLSRDNYGGNYIHYGAREHVMSAIMNGLALHKGVIPFGGTFLVFTDYCKPGIRLSALMGKRVIYIMTHDSIGLGEDGPTHQPIEHLAMLRGIPNLLVFRPCDATEVAECWELALMAKHIPSVIVLSRQNLPLIRTEYIPQNITTLGAYLIAKSELKTETKVCLIATGSEVHIALNAHAELEAKGIASSVISMPCWQLFNQQSMDYRHTLFGGDTLKVVVEAASGMGWRSYTGDKGLVIGMRSFGASGPAEKLYKHFGFTPEAIVQKIEEYFIYGDQSSD